MPLTLPSPPAAGMSTRVAMKRSFSLSVKSMRLNSTSRPTSCGRSIVSNGNRQQQQREQQEHEHQEERHEKSAAGGSSSSVRQKRKRSEATPEARVY